MPDTPQVGRIEQLMAIAETKMQWAREVAARAEEVHRLRARITELEARERELLEALKPFAEPYESWDMDQLDDGSFVADASPFIDITAGDVRRAYELVKPAETAAKEQGESE